MMFYMMYYSILHYKFHFDSFDSEHSEHTHLTQSDFKLAHKILSSEHFECDFVV